MALVNFAETMIDVKNIIAVNPRGPVLEVYLKGHGSRPILVTDPRAVAAIKAHRKSLAKGKEDKPGKG